MNGYINKKMIWGVTISFLFLIIMVSCSGMKKILSWGEEKSVIEDKEISQIVSNVQPYQGNPDSHYLLGCYNQERGKYREAIEEFNKVLLIDPNHVRAYNGMGTSYDLLGDFQRAIESYKKALNLNPNLDYVQNNLGYSYLLQGNLDEAIPAFKKAVALNDQDRRFHNNLGLAYAEKGQFDLALIEFKLAEDEANAHYNMAQVYYKKALYGEAKSHYISALSLNPSLIAARTGLEAATVLARIFVPTPSNTKPKELIVPDQPITGKPEIEKLIASDQGTTTEGGVEKEVIHEQSLAPIQAVNLSTPRPEGLGVDAEPASSTPSSKTAKGVKTEKLNQRDEAKMLNSMKDIQIEISNGNGVHRIAKRIGHSLTEKGLRAIRFSNADHFRYQRTRILYQKEYEELAYYVAEELPVLYNVRESKNLNGSRIKIKVILGNDIVPYSGLFKEFEKGQGS